MKNKFLPLPLWVALWLFACTPEPIPPHVKQDPCPWPEITTEGLNTFACKIDGVEWVACVDIWGQASTLRPIECTISEWPDSNILAFSIIRHVSDTSYSYVGQDKILSCRFEPVQKGDFDLNNGKTKYSIDLYESDGLNRSFEKMDTTSPGFIHITRLDATKKIVSGTFEFTLLERHTGEKIHISDGRFDVIYYPQ